MVTAGLEVGADIRTNKWVEEMESDWGPFSTRFNAKGLDVVIRPVRHCDTEQLFDVISSNRAHLERWLPQMRGAFKTVGEVARNVDYWLWKMHTARGLVMGVHVEGELKGILSINIIDWDSKCAYLGYWLAKDVEGRGIATMGMQHVIKMAFDYLHLDHLDISTMRSNVRSKALARRLGFRHQPDIHDLDTQYLFGILPVKKVNLDVFTRSKEDAPDSIDEARKPYFWYNLRHHIQENLEPVVLGVDTKKLLRHANRVVSETLP